MRLILPEEYTKYFRTVFPFILILVAIHTIFYDWQFQLYRFDEWEDFGALIFALIVCFFESALFTFFLWLVLRLLKKFWGKQIRTPKT